MYPNAAKSLAAYAQASATVANTRQVTMLYDGMIRLMHTIRAAIEENNIEARYNNITKVEQIITGLQSALDHKAAPEMARLIDNFYLSFFLRLSNLHFKPDIAQCDQLIKELILMRDAWDEVDKSLSGN